MAHFTVLGPLGAELARGPADLRGPRHRAVLARLLVARGRAVPLDALVADLWDDAPPPGARGAVQTFVGDLRKALEPDRPPRTPPSLLVTVAGGYALRADDTDARRFETAVREAASAPPERARALLTDALALWRGRAYAEFADLPWALAESTALEELRLLAVERLAETALALDAPADAVPPLTPHAAAHPHREHAARLLALALYRTGRQGEALEALRRTGKALRADLGVDPGEPLRALEADILAQSPTLLAPRRPPAPHPTAAQQTTTSQTAAPQATTPQPTPPLFGREEELATLTRAAEEAVTTARLRHVLVSGAAGSGKSALTEALATRLRAAGWSTATTTCPDLPGTPKAWPWTTLRTRLGLPPEPDRTPRFTTLRTLSAHLSGPQPALLVLDDLHQADEDTLALLTALPPDAGPTLVVSTHRATDIPPALTAALARLARTTPTRLYLSGLDERAVADLIATHRPPTPQATRAVHTRSAGNPFLAHELARLWASEGDEALRTVPAGVRDVLLHRLSALPETTRAHLRQAAVLGHEVDLPVLAELAGEDVLDSVESAIAAGFLVEHDADHVRFAHALVHETVRADTTAPRRARWHVAAADAVERATPDEHERIAHHLLEAATRSTATRAAHHAARAATRAERRSAPHEAARLWRAVITSLDRAPTQDPPARLTAVMGLVRALAVTGDLASARAHRAEAARQAETLPDPVHRARVVGSFDVPALWTTPDDDALSTALAESAERALKALPATHRSDRARLLVTIAMERRADPNGEAAEAAEEAERIARALADPVLLSLALNARYLQTFHRAGLAPEREALAAELLQVTESQPDLVAFEVLAHLLLVQSSAAMADLPAADHHAARADHLATRDDLPMVAPFTEWYRAMRLALTGRKAEAEAAYRAAAPKLTATHLPGVVTGLLPLALHTLDVPQSTPDWGANHPWTTPTTNIPKAPHDHLHELRTCLHARTALARSTRDHAELEALRRSLSPAEDELAGASTGLVSLGPVAGYLADLAQALDDPAEATRLRAKATTITTRLREA
ncbi:MULTISPECIES: BTAD domain-containing putative transcriptional regulator [Actinosynnema]|uniref:BTAD domain-containing putative transcriptional regulator n=1 Tax=Actinosynnema TaxID=40566 RepID=UPI0020A40FA3|nr:BTAD domain-containing putative transcriptional regulator [Actinosynnema pretiosum]MCP2098047.1 DNA-binding transcriptional activator of the SARP family [Actinosynnema pretiosum]